MQSNGVASERAICGEALVFAHEEELVVDTVKTHTGNELSGITVEDVEIEGKTVSYLTGQDAAGVQVIFDFHYPKGELKEVEVYRGRAGGEYGVVTQVSI